jgi:hypothetical protein
MNLIPFVVAWSLLAAAVLGLAIYRKMVARSEDDFIHIRDIDTALIAKQQAVSSRLNFVDHWGKTMTIVVFVLGLLLATVYIWQTWVESTRAAI